MSQPDPRLYSPHHAEHGGNGGNSIGVLGSLLLIMAKARDAQGYTATILLLSAGCARSSFPS